MLAGTVTSRLTVANPGKVKVIVYSPGRTSTMVYRPSPAVTTARERSISASLAASTLTPEITAPLMSFTTPEIVLWANAVGTDAVRTTRLANI